MNATLIFSRVHDIQITMQMTMFYKVPVLNREVHRKNQNQSESENLIHPRGICIKKDIYKKKKNGFSTEP